MNKEINEYEVKYKFLMKYLMSKLQYNTITEKVDFDYKFPDDDFIEILKALDPIFDAKIGFIEREAEKDEDTN